MTASQLFPGFDLPDDYAEARRFEWKIAKACRWAREAEVCEATLAFFAASGPQRASCRAALRRHIAAYRRAMRKRDTAFHALYPHVAARLEHVA